MKDTISKLTPAFLVILLCVNQLVHLAYLNWALVGIAISIAIAPFVVAFISERRTLTIAKALDILQSHGVEAELDGDVIRWQSDEKVGEIRIDGRLLQVSRYFKLPGESDTFHGMEKAAAETMNEVSMAKVVVSHNDTSEITLHFSAEAICATPKEFNDSFPAYARVLDVAEERQRFHFKEGKPERRKIGFKS